MPLGFELDYVITFVDIAKKATYAAELIDDTSGIVTTSDALRLAQQKRLVADKKVQQDNFQKLIIAAEAEYPLLKTDLLPKWTALLDQFVVSRSGVYVWNFAIWVDTGFNKAPSLGGSDYTVITNYLKLQMMGAYEQLINALNSITTTTSSGVSTTTTNNVFMATVPGEVKSLALAAYSQFYAKFYYDPVAAATAEDERGRVNKLWEATPTFLLDPSINNGFWNYLVPLIGDKAAKGDNSPNPGSPTVLTEIDKIIQGALSSPAGKTYLQLLTTAVAPTFVPAEQLLLNDKNVDRFQNLAEATSSLATKLQAQFLLDEANNADPSPSASKAQILKQLEKAIKEEKKKLLLGAIATDPEVTNNLEGTVSPDTKELQTTKKTVKKLNVDKIVTLGMFPNNSDTSGKASEVLKGDVVDPSYNPTVTPENVTTAITLNIGNPDAIQKSLEGKVTQLLSEDLNDFRAVQLVLPFNTGEKVVSYFSLMDEPYSVQVKSAEASKGGTEKPSIANPFAGGARYNQFFLQGLDESHSEKFQLIDTLSSGQVIFSFGKKPEFWTIRGQLLNDAANNWTSKMRQLWESQIRISKLAETGKYLRVAVPATRIVFNGYPVALTLSHNTENEALTNFAMMIFIRGWETMPNITLTMKTGAAEILNSVVAFQGYEIKELISQQAVAPSSLPSGPATTETTVPPDLALPAIPKLAIDSSLSSLGGYKTGAPNILGYGASL